MDTHVLIILQKGSGDLTALELHGVGKAVRDCEERNLCCSDNAESIGHFCGYRCATSSLQTVQQFCFLRAIYQLSCIHSHAYRA